MGKIKRTEWSAEFKDARSTGDANKERNDCAVIAVSIACDTPYEEVHRRMAINGRKSRKGTPNTLTTAVVASLGYECRKVDQQAELWPRLTGVHRGLKYLTSYTAQRFPGQVFKRNKTYLCRSNGHIWCVKYGKVQDWSVNACLRIVDVWEVSPIIDE